MHERLLDETEAAGMLGMSVGWLRGCRNGRHRKGPPCIKLGTRVRYRYEDLLRFITENTQ